ncbi:MAG: type IV pilus assembly protein PilC [Bradymonadia bacterium]|jgi:type IV pilus assembly protein PilC
MSSAEPEEAPAVATGSTPSVFKRASRGRIASFIREFGTLVNAGFPVIRALEVIGHNTQNRHLVSTITAISERIDSGNAVYRAFELHPWYFDTVVTNIIRVSEESGRLGEGLEYVADMLDEENVIRAKMANALSYPFVLLSLAVGVVFIMLFVVVPRFTAVIELAGGQLEGTSKTVSDLSTFVTSPVGFVVAVLMCVLPFVGLFLFRKTRRERFDTLMGSLPLLGRLFLLAELTRVATMLRLMTINGVPIRNALLLARGAVSNTYVKQAVGAMAESAEQGKSLAEPLQQFGALPYIFPEMIAVGEESGRLPDMLGHLAANMRRRLSDAVERAPAILQPLLLIFIGGLVVLIFVTYLFQYFDLLTAVSGYQ